VKKNTYARWIPVILPSLPERYEQDPTKYPPKFAFWNKGTAFYYPYLLISMGLMNDRSVFKIPDGCTVMGDSGGFQFGKSGFEHLQPEWVMEKQEECATKGFILDRPPQYKNNDPNYTDELFERCLRTTAEHADRMQKVRTNDDFELYGVIQGRDEKDWDIWLKRLEKDYDYVGWGMGNPTMGGAKRVVKILKWFGERGITKNIHLFGLLSEVYTAVMAHGAYLYGLKNLTFDSSVKPMYIKPPQILGIIQRRGGRNLQEFNEPFCTCQLCEAYREIENPTEQARTSYVTIHNIYVYLSQFEWLNSVANEPEDLKILARGSDVFLDMFYNDHHEDEKQQKLF
jgi:tRNA-guanine family transglycosylase